jgi:hypothetical protein
MKKAAIILLVLLVLLVGLPSAIGLSDMAPCPSCKEGDAPIAVALCLAIVSLFVLVMSSNSSLVRSKRRVFRFLLLADPPERPPRLA